MGALAVRPAATSAAVVRHCIADDLVLRQVHEDSIADVVLVASELVSNAVLHTGGDAADLDISWDLAEDAVTVRVGDPSAQLPELRPSDDVHSGGRGLAIVACIARDWGVQSSPTGKQVWARVPVSRG